MGLLLRRPGLHGATRVVNFGFNRLGIGGDLIEAIDGKPVESETSLTRAMTQKRGNDTITLTIYRDGRTTKMPIKLGSAPEPLR